MTNNLEMLQAAPASVGRIDRQTTTARQSRWMLELEQAMLADAAQGQPETAAYDARDQGAVSAVRAAGAARQPADTASSAGIAAASAGTANVAPAALTTTAAPAPGAAAPGAAAPVAPPRAGAAANARAAPSRTAGAPDPAAGAAAGSGADNAAPPLEAARQADANGYSTVAFGAAAAAGAGGGPAEVGGAEVAASTPVTGTTLVSAGQALKLELPDARTPGDADSAVDEQEATQGQAFGAADGTDYAERLMHLYHSADGVQAWIRDAALEGGQLPGLAQSMSSELAASGATLTALTVNGRKLALPRQGMGADPVSGRPATEEAGLSASAITSIQRKETTG